MTDMDTPNTPLKSELASGWGGVREGPTRKETERPN